MKRRDFLRRTAAAAAGAGFFRLLPAVEAGVSAPAPVRESENLSLPFRISLAEWSLVKTLKSKRLDNLDFPRYARSEFGIDTVEYVDQFFSDKSRDTTYLAELKKRCESEGVRSGLIMVDTAGDLGPRTPKSGRSRWRSIAGGSTLRARSAATRCG